MDYIKLKKRKKIILIVLIIALVFIIGIIVGLIYKHYHPTHFRYNDSFILGNTIENVRERYGEFDIEHILEYNPGDPIESQASEGISVTAYLVREEYAGFLGLNYAKYYWIYFDAEGIAFKVKVDTAPSAGY